MDEPELLFLIWRALASGPLAGTANLLEEEASKHGLLPTRVDIAGNIRPVAFAEHGSAHPHIPADALKQLLGKLLAQNKPVGNDGLQVVSLTAPGKHGLLGRPEPPLPAWWKRPPAQASLAHQLLARETGMCRSRPGICNSAPLAASTSATTPSPTSPVPALASPAPPSAAATVVPASASALAPAAAATAAAAIAPTVAAASVGNGGCGSGGGAGGLLTGLLCRQMRHLTTVRGHRLAVYCCTYDNTGRRIITGSDDCVVKIWSAETGVLLKSCRGHDAEITDFAVSCDNKLLASGDTACSIRVWSLQEDTLGWPVSVLSGHTGAVSFLDFHPHLPDALLSCSIDSTCRIWNARDPGVAALVLRPGATFGTAQGSHGSPEGQDGVGGQGTGVQGAMGQEGGGGQGQGQSEGVGDPVERREDGGAVGRLAVAAGTGSDAGAVLSPIGGPAGAGGSAVAIGGSGNMGNAAATGDGGGAGPSQSLSQFGQEAAAAAMGAGSGRGGAEPGNGEDAGPSAGAGGGGGAEAAVAVAGRPTRGSVVADSSVAEAAGQAGAAGGDAGAAAVAAAGAGAARPNRGSAAAAAQQQQQQLSFLCCSWSPNGAFIFAGGSDCAVYVWLWDLTPPPLLKPPPLPLQPQQQPSQPSQQQQQHPCPQSLPPQQQQDQPSLQSAVALGHDEQYPGDGQGTQRDTGMDVDTDINGDATAAADAAANALTASATTTATGHDGGGAGAVAGPSAMPGGGFGGGDDGGGGCRASTVVGGEDAATCDGGSRPAEESLAAAWEGREWPRPVELALLPGHRNDIVFIEFSHDGRCVATASKDGCVKVWRHGRERGCGLLASNGGGNGGGLRPSRPSKEAMVWRQVLSLACPATEEDIRKARLKRKPPPQPAINQVAWNLDDSRVVAAVTDNSVRVWDARSGEPTHILLEHTAQAHVVEAHPHDARLVMTGGYDGRTILWDVMSGTALKTFSTQDTFPGRGRWTDPMQLVDGHFSPDGAQLAVTDTAGQLHVYGIAVAAAPHIMARAPYDQFLATDYNNLMRDANGWVLDELTQRPPHLMPHQLLCDYANHPHPMEVQAAYSARRLGDLPRPHPVDRNHPLPPALLTHPPTLVAASWLAVENGASGAAVHAAMNRAYERHMAALEALTRPELPHPHRGSRRLSVRNAGGSGRPGSEPPPQRQRPLTGTAAASAAAAATIPRGVYLVVDDPTAPPPPLLLHFAADSDGSDGGGGISSDGDDENDEDVIIVSDGGDGGGASSSSSSSSDDDEGRNGGEDDDDEEGLWMDSDEAGGGGRTRPGGGRSQSGGRRRQRLRRLRRGDGRSRRDGSAPVSGGDGGGGSGAGGSREALEEGRTLRRSSRRERARAEGDEAGEQERIRRSARLSGHKRRYGDAADGGTVSYSSDDVDFMEEDDEEEEEGGSGLEEEAAEDDSDEDAAAARQRQRRRQRERERERRAALRAQRELRNQQRREQRREARRRQQEQRYLTTTAVPPPAAAAAIAAATAAGAAAAAAVGPAAAAPRAAFRARSAVPAALPAAAVAAAEAGVEEWGEEGLGDAVVPLRQVARRRSHEAGGSRPRPLACYSWLQGAAYLPGCYCPQLGEEVVYVRGAHEANLEATGDERTSRPWQLLPAMRPSEPCVIRELGFEILRDGTLRTAANLSLQVDPGSDSPLAGHTFAVQLPPPPPADQPAPAFLLPLPRFNRAVTKRWSIGERCKAFFQSPARMGAAASAAAESSSGSGGGGSWVGGVVVADRLHPGLAPAHGEAPPLRQPHECEGLWQRYTVRWDGAAGNETSSVSSWDLLPASSSWDEVVRFARATAAAKADEIFAAAAAAAATAATGPSTSAAPAAAAAATSPTAAELGLELGGGWAEEQAHAARLALERLLAEERLYGLFVQCPAPTATFPCSDGDRRPVPYNAVVPLPLGLEVIEKRLDESFYRSLAAVRHDMDTIVSNAERFNGADSAVAQRSREMRLLFTAALTGRCVDDMILFGPDVAVPRRRRRRQRPCTTAAEMAAEAGLRRPRTDLSRLWAHVALGVEELAAVAEASGDGAGIQAAGGRSVCGGGGTAAGAVRGGVDAAGGYSGPRRRGGMCGPPDSLAACFEDGAEAAEAVEDRLGAAAVDGGDGGGWHGSTAVEAYDDAAGTATLQPGLSYVSQHQNQQLQQLRYHHPHGLPQHQHHQQQNHEAQPAMQVMHQHQQHPSVMQRTRHGLHEHQREQQQEEEQGRPRRSTARNPRVGRQLRSRRYGSDGDQDEDDEEEVDAAADTSDEEFAAADHGADDEDDESYSEGESRRRRGSQRQRQSQRLLSPSSQQRRQGLRRRQQHQQRQRPAPLRRSGRARQRTRYGSDWEDDDDDDDGDSDRGGGSGGGGGEVLRRSARRPQRAAAADGGVNAVFREANGAGSDGGGDDGAAVAMALPPFSKGQPPPPSLLPSPTLFASAAGWPGMRPPPPPAAATASPPFPYSLPGFPPMAEAGLPGVDASYDEENGVEGAVSADDGLAGTGTNAGSGRLRIRLRGMKDPPPPPASAARHMRPSFVQQQQQQQPRLQPHLAAPMHSGPRAPARAAAAGPAAAGAAAAPSPSGGGRSRRAAAVAAVAAVAAAARAAARSDDDDDDEEEEDSVEEDRRQAAAAQSRRPHATRSRQRGGVSGAQFRHDDMAATAAAGPAPTAFGVAMHPAFPPPQAYHHSLYLQQQDQQEHHQQQPVYAMAVAQAEDINAGSLLPAAPPLGWAPPTASIASGDADYGHASYLYGNPHPMQLPEHAAFAANMAAPAAALPYGHWPGQPLSYGVPWPPGQPWTGELEDTQGLYAAQDFPNE